MKIEYKSSLGIKTTFTAPLSWSKKDVINYIVKKSGSSVKFF